MFFNYNTGTCKLKQKKKLGNMQAKMLTFSNITKQLKKKIQLKLRAQGEGGKPFFIEIQSNFLQN